MSSCPLFTQRSLTTLATVLIAGVTVPIAQAAPLTWDGNGANDNWSYININPSSLTVKNTNWTAPANGNCSVFECKLSLPLLKNDSLLFADSLRLTPFNDLHDFSVAGISFAGNAGAFTLNGNGLVNTGNITNSSSNLQTINLAVSVGANQTWNGGAAGILVKGFNFAGESGYILDGSNVTSIGNISNNSAYLQAINLPINIGSDQTWDGGSAGMVVNGTVNFGNHELILQNHIAVNNSAATVIIGNNGIASLNLQSGSTLNNANGNLGNGLGGQGVATVTGDNSQWNNSGGLTIGSNGTGRLYIENGGKVTNTNAVLGIRSGIFNDGIGFAQVSGADSQWINSGDLFLGFAGSGTLIIKNGGKVESTAGYLGRLGSSAGGSTGTATLTGADSQWINSSHLYIGYGGNGTLYAGNGARVGNDNGYLGHEIGSVGTATVTGADTQWNNSYELIVGYGGNGILNVENGAKVRSISGYLGRENGSIGIATVTGADSEWINSGDLYVGNVFGDDPIHPQIFYTASGSLNIENGGKVSSSSGSINLGTATVTGVNSQWNISASLQINDVLNIKEGGQVNNTDGVVASYYGSSGKVSVTGANSQWNNRGDLYVGFPGNKGTLDIDNGGTVSVSGALSIGSLSQVNLSGGTLSLADVSTIDGAFNWSSGSLRFTHPQGVALGDNPLLPQLSHLGSGQILDVSETLSINTGNFLLLDGGQLKAGKLALNGGLLGGTALDVSDISLLSGHGTVASAITGGTAANTIQASGGNLDLGTSNADNGFDFGGNLIIGANQVNLLDKDQAHLGVSTSLSDGGRLNAANGLALGSGETLSYSGNASILGNFTNNGAVALNSNVRTGQLTFLNDVNGAGSFAGDIVFHAGYNPGNSPAAIDFNGGNALYDASSLLTMEILGATAGTEYDQLLNIDHLAFNGILNLAFGPGFTASAGQGFDLFDFNSFSGSLAADRITVSGIDRNRLNLGNLASTGRLQIAAVPLPAGVWLFASGLALLGFGRRRVSL